MTSFEILITFNQSSHLLFTSNENNETRSTFTFQEYGNSLDSSLQKDFLLSIFKDT